tara:strand:- start:152 stop:907 length:756 start_codon:yes stop_codon:yes gene_type:complete
MNTLLLFNQTNFSTSNWWKLKSHTIGYKNEQDSQIVTEIAKNRCFKLVEIDLKRKNHKFKSRYLVQLFEDGYLCWINIQGLEIERCSNYFSKRFICNELFIRNKMPSILNWIDLQSKEVNKYKWGGTLGPDFDCSGLIQAAFMRQEIYIPRDSYQIMRFCRHLFNFPRKTNQLQMGDLLFFGDNNECNHVAIYYQNGIYYHSSGIEFGRNGISKEKLYESKYDDKTSRYYRSKLICAGRVTRSYQWNKFLR